MTPEIIKQILYENFKEVEAIIKKDKTLVNVKCDTCASFDKLGEMRPLTEYTPLHAANEKNQKLSLEFTTLLLENGANVNAQDSMGNTPLHYAYGSNFVNCVKLLIDYGANTSIKNNNDHFPLDMKIK